MALRDKIKKGGPQKPQSVAPPRMPEALSEPPVQLPAPASLVEERAAPPPAPAPAVEEKPLRREEPPATARSVPVSPPKAAPAAALKPSVSPRPAPAAKTPPPLPAIEEQDKTPIPGPLTAHDEPSGEMVSVSELVESVPPSAPAPTVAARKNPLAGLDLAALAAEEPKEAAEEAPQSSPARKSEPPPSPKVNNGRKAWAFDAENDEGASIEIVSGYKLKYMDRSPNGLSFRLKGAESQDIQVGLDESKTVNVDSPDGPLAITVKNTGLNGEGSMEVEVAWEGGKKKSVKAAETAKKAAAETGKKTASGIVAHSAEIAVGLVTAAVPVAYFAFGGTQLREAMGSLLYYIGGAGVPAVMAALAVWRGVERRSEIREEAAEAAKEPSK